MITRAARPAQRWGRARHIVLAWATLAHAAATAGVGLASDATPAGAPPDSAPSFGTLTVHSLPSGLSVLVDSLAAGRTPIDSVQVEAGSHLVRVLEPDPRRFDPAIDAVRITIHRGARVSVLLDVRPSVLLRSEPEAASVTLTSRAAEAPDTSLGETPLRVRPSIVEQARLRFALPGYADTTLAGSWFTRDSAAVVSVRLRQGPSIAAPPPSLSAGAPLYRKGWFQWSLIGIGAALSGAAVVFHHQGDDAYDRYLRSSDVSEIPDLYDEAVRYDRWAAASLAVGQACFVSGFVLLVTGQR